MKKLTRLSAKKILTSTITTTDIHEKVVCCNTKFLQSLKDPQLTETLSILADPDFTSTLVALKDWYSNTEIVPPSPHHQTPSGFTGPLSDIPVQPHLGIKPSNSQTTSSIPDKTVIKIAL